MGRRSPRLGDPNWASNPVPLGEQAHDRLRYVTHLDRDLDRHCSHDLRQPFDVDAAYGDLQFVMTFRRLDCNIYLFPRKYKRYLTQCAIHDTSSAVNSL